MTHLALLPIMLFVRNAEGELVFIKVEKLEDIIEILGTERRSAKHRVKLGGCSLIG